MVTPTTRNCTLQKLGLIDVSLLLGFVYQGIYYILMIPTLNQHVYGKQLSLKHVAVDVQLGTTNKSILIYQVVSNLLYDYDY